jgi:hypothetical protein
MFDDFPRVSSIVRLVTGDERENAFDIVELRDICK